MSAARLLDDRGLTLVEVLLAVAVLGVGLVGLGVIVPVSSYSVRDGNWLSTATFLAEQMVERTRAARWTLEPAVDCLGASPENAAPVPTGATCDGAVTTQFPDEAGGVSGAPQFQRIVRITGCDAGPCAGVNASGLRLVEVTVVYPRLSAEGVSGAARTVQLAWLASRK